MFQSGRHSCLQGALFKFKFTCIFYNISVRHIAYRLRPWLLTPIADPITPGTIHRAPTVKHDLSLSSASKSSFWYMGRAEVLLVTILLLLAAK